MTVSQTVDIASEIQSLTLELNAWRNWLALAEQLAGRALEHDLEALRAFEEGVYPEVYLGATAAPCETCKQPGAPDHEPSPRCQYRPRTVNHCTCRACFG